MTRRIIAGWLVGASDDDQRDARQLGWARQGALEDAPTERIDRSMMAFLRRRRLEGDPPRPSVGLG